jgi:transcriptional regulator with XRE-family HTH domain
LTYVRQSQYDGFMELVAMPETQFGNRLAELRKAAGLSQPALAKKSRVPLGSLRDLEQGRRTPSWTRVQELARALGVSVAEFDKPSKRK